MAEGLFGKIKEGLAKTRGSLSERVNGIIGAFRRIDAEFFEELEETLILGDMGVAAAARVIDALKSRVRDERLSAPEEIKSALADVIEDMLRTTERPFSYPAAILVAGVNGVGKTTAIGKLAHRYRAEGKRVLLAAADTFRAAAADQLSIWAQRAGVPIVKYAQEGADPAAVVYDAIDSCKAKNMDVLLIDTAGRLHNKKNLMAELNKIRTVLDRGFAQAHRETFLVLDASTGQNALAQARSFLEIADVTGIILTKIDGTAKGGVVCAVAEELKLPVRYLGVGEGMEDLQPFDARTFARNLIE